MLICKEGVYAYTGNTAEEAYRTYLESPDDHDVLTPEELEWFKAEKVTVTMQVASKPLDVKPAVKKPAVKKPAVKKPGSKE